MKKLVYIVLLLIITSPLFGQSTENKIKTIIKSVDEINKGTGYIIKEHDFTPSSAKVKGLYKERVLKKIIYKIEYIQGYSLTEYYFNNNHLIFLNEKQEEYVAIKGGSEKVNPIDSLFAHSRTVYEGKYYFSKKGMFDSHIQDERTHKIKAIGDYENKDKVIADNIVDYTQQLSSAGVIEDK